MSNTGHEGAKGGGKGRRGHFHVAPGQPVNTEMHLLMRARREHGHAAATGNNKDAKRADRKPNRPNRRDGN